MKFQVEEIDHEDMKVVLSVIPESDEDFDETGNPQLEDLEEFFQNVIRSYGYRTGQAWYADQRNVIWKSKVSE